jgi:site-specific DNA-cytosine methylase
MKVLVACEMSGRVRDAFIKRGHEAMSCDLLDTLVEGPHYKGDVFDIINDGWDLMIAHPPCTDIAISGSKYFKEKIADGRQQLALNFVRRLIEADIGKIAIENPVSVISTHIRKPDQIIQPYEYGHDASKRTCLWLKNLPLLIGTSYITPRIVEGKRRWANQTDSGQNRLGPSEDRAAIRSLTYTGIAEAMAEQWSE